jgi:hypothetical protein
LKENGYIFIKDTLILWDQTSLTDEQKNHHKNLASNRVVNENVIGVVKRFNIIDDKHRNRRKRFGLRFNLIAGIYNWELNN